MPPPVTTQKTGARPSALLADSWLALAARYPRQ